MVLGIHAKLQYGHCSTSSDCFVCHAQEKVGSIRLQVSAKHTGCLLKEQSPKANSQRENITVEIETYHQRKKIERVRAHLVDRRMVADCQSKSCIRKQIHKTHAGQNKEKTGLIL